MSDIIKVSMQLAGPRRLIVTVHGVHPDLREIDSLEGMLRRRPSPRREQILRAYALGMLIDFALLDADRAAIGAGAASFEFMAAVQRASAEDDPAPPWPESDSCFEPDVVTQIVHACTVTAVHREDDYRACYLQLDVELTSERWANHFAGASWSTAFNLQLIG